LREKKKGGGSGRKVDRIRYSMRKKKLIREKKRKNFVEKKRQKSAAGEGD